MTFFAQGSVCMIFTSQGSVPDEGAIGCPHPPHLGRDCNFLCHTASSPPPDVARVRLYAAVLPLFEGALRTFGRPVLPTTYKAYAFRGAHFLSCLLLYVHLMFLFLCRIFLCPWPSRMFLDGFEHYSAPVGRSRFLAGGLRAHPTSRTPVQTGVN